MVDANIALVPLLVLDQVRRVIVESSRTGRQWIGIDDFGRHRIPATARNLISGELIANEAAAAGIGYRRQRIVDRPGLAEVALPHLDSRNVTQDELLGVATISLVVDEKERPIASLVDLRKNHWPTKR